MHDQSAARAGETDQILQMDGVKRDKRVNVLRFKQLRAFAEAVHQKHALKVGHLSAPFNV
jgi:hypothetical protein